MSAQLDFGIKSSNIGEVGILHIFLDSGLFWIHYPQRVPPQSAILLMDQLVYLTFQTLSKIYIKRVTIWSFLTRKLIKSIFCWQKFHIWDCGLPTAEIRTGPLMVVPGHGGSSPFRRWPIRRWTPRKSFHEAPPAPECRVKEIKHFPMYPCSTFVEYLFNVERGRFCAEFLVAISDE